MDSQGVITVLIIPTPISFYAIKYNTAYSNKPCHNIDLIESLLRLFFSSRLIYGDDTGFFGVYTVK